MVTSWRSSWWKRWRTNRRCSSPSPATGNPPIANEPRPPDSMGISSSQSTLASSGNSSTGCSPNNARRKAPATAPSVAPVVSGFSRTVIRSGPRTGPATGGWARGRAIVSARAHVFPGCPPADRPPLLLIAVLHRRGCARGGALEDVVWIGLNHPQLVAARRDEHVERRPAVEDYRP